MMSRPAVPNTEPAMAAHYYALDRAAMCYREGLRHIVEECGNDKPRIDHIREAAERACDACDGVEAELSRLREERDAAQREADIQMGEKIAAQVTLKAITDSLCLPLAELGDGWTEATRKILARIEEIVDQGVREGRERDALEIERDAAREHSREASEMYVQANEQITELLQQQSFMERKLAAQREDIERLATRVETAEAEVERLRSDKDERDWRTLEIVTKQAEAAEARCARLQQALERAVFLAQHLHAMVPKSVWRDSGGDDMQGHYEGDYHAEKVAEELKALAGPDKEDER